jgi:anti-anti-sigma factor
MFERAKQGVVNVISGDDPLNVDSLSEVTQLLDECIAEGQPRIVIDFQAIPLIDSAGLELLLDVYDQCVQRGGMLCLAGPNCLCRDILRITGVAERSEIHEDALSAVGSFV